jgi:hypothetical protein
VNIDHEIDHTHRTILITISGDMSDQELLGVADLIERMPAISPDFSILFDLRSANGEGVTSEGVRVAAMRPLVLSPQSRRGIVVPSMLGFGMARMYQLFRGESTTRVFMDYDKARRWVETGSG